MSARGGSCGASRAKAFDAEIGFDTDNPESGRIVGVVQTESVNTRDYDRDATLTEPELVQHKPISGSQIRI